MSFQLVDSSFPFSWYNYVCADLCVRRGWVVRGLRRPELPWLFLRLRPCPWPQGSCCASASPPAPDAPSLRPPRPCWHPEIHTNTHSPHQFTEITSLSTLCASLVFLTLFSLFKGHKKLIYSPLWKTWGEKKGKKEKPTRRAYKLITRAALANPRFCFSSFLFFDHIFVNETFHQQEWSRHPYTTILEVHLMNRWCLSGWNERFETSLSS